MTRILEKLIGYCCEQEMVDAANAELDALRAAAEENARLREALSEVCAWEPPDGQEMVHSRAVAALKGDERRRERDPKYADKASYAKGWNEAVDQALEIVKAHLPLHGNRGEPSKTVASKLDYIAERIEALKGTAS